MLLAFLVFRLSISHVCASSMIKVKTEGNALVLPSYLQGPEPRGAAHLLFPARSLLRHPSRPLRVPHVQPAPAWSEDRMAERQALLEGLAMGGDSGETSKSTHRAPAL